MFTIRYLCGCVVYSAYIKYEKKERFLPVEFLICSQHRKECEKYIENIEIADLGKEEKKVRKKV